MIIERAIESAGLTLEADRLPAGQRTVKVFQRFISEMRKGEAQLLADERELTRQFVAQGEKLLAKEEENHQLRERLRFYELRERVESLELPTATKALLLGSDESDKSAAA
jgi:hypothetical protein